ncbi:hypothetical protein LINGRAPRIM_LOCUS3057 [Linum grandiflorum]
MRKKKIRYALRSVLRRKRRLIFDVHGAQH